MLPPNPPRRKSSAVGERRRVLTQWHGIDLVPLETARKDHSQPIGMFVNKLVGDLRLDRRRAEAEIVKVWNHLMDPNIAAHAQPVGLTKGTLFVTVDSSPWLDEIVRYRRKEILDRLQNSFGKETIVKISFRVG